MYLPACLAAAGAQPWDRGHYFIFSEVFHNLQKKVLWISRNQKYDFSIICCTVPNAQTKLNFGIMRPPTNKWIIQNITFFRATFILVYSVVNNMGKAILKNVIFMCFFCFFCENWPNKNRSYWTVGPIVLIFSKYVFEFYGTNAVPRHFSIFTYQVS